MTVRILIGDVRAKLKELPDESVHMAVTSPPYWRLRDYGTGTWVGGDPACTHEPPPSRHRGKHTAASRHGHRSKAERDHRSCRCGAVREDDQLGMEESPADYIATMVEVLREVRRVLRKDGTLWLNMGDCYAGQSGGWQGKNGSRASRTFTARIRAKKAGGLCIKRKDQILMPARLAIALCDDGWYIRRRIIWYKPNAMPESVRDRPANAHEDVYLLSKRPRYFFDAEAVKEPASTETHARVAAGRKKPAGWDMGPGGHRSLAGRYSNGVTPKTTDERNGNRNNASFMAAVSPIVVETRNMRDVWVIPTEPYPDAHFATFPLAIPERCILAGTSERGVCPHCGAPWLRVVKRRRVNSSNAAKAGTKIKGKGHPTSQAREDHDVRNGPVAITKTVGWKPGCGCADNVPVPATVLDPFGGAGTTGLAAARLRRNAILIELKPAYAEMAHARLKAALVEDVKGAKPRMQAGPLFEDVAA
jgi:DNA modification methylase